MFSNPFNSKIVSDITKFLSEHKDAIDIDPCLNEAVSECGCRGNTKDANDFAKAVDLHIREGKKSLPPAFLKNIQKKKDAAKKKDGEDKKEEVEEGFAQPTEKELRASVKWLESILKDPKKLKESDLSRRDAEDNLAAAKDMLAFGKAHGSKIKP